MKKSLSLLLLPAIIFGAVQAQTWNQQNTNLNLIINDVNFVDEDYGFAVSVHGGSPPQSKILNTVNGGTEWIWQNSGTVQDLLCIKAISQNQVWAGGETGTIIHTDNGFQSWDFQNVGGNWDIYGIEFIDSLRGWATGDGGTVLHTENGGLNWNVQPTPIGIIMRAIDFIDENRGWAAGISCTIIHTNDGGNSWTVQNTPSNLLLYDICFADSLHGWACGNAGLMLHTSDGGLNWVVQNSGTGLVLYSVDFVDEMEGWACGNGGAIIHTIDGGSNWFSDASGVSMALKGIDFINSQNGWCCGNLGTMLNYICQPVPNITIDLIPESANIIVPVNGGSFDFEVVINNQEADSVEFDAWTNVICPNSSVYGPIIMRSLNMQPNSIISRNLSQYVPGNAPWGNYTYQGFVGIYPDDVWDYDYFHFQKAP